MKIKGTISCGFAAACIFAADANGQGKSPALKTNLDSVSYSIGSDMGRSMFVNYEQVKEKYVKDMNQAAFLQGIKDLILQEEIKAGRAKAGKKTKPAISEEGAQKILEAFGQKMRANMAEEARMKGEIAAAAGKAYLEQNKKRPGVITLESGVQYEIIKEGNGPKPLLTDQVTVHYTGTLIDGTIFDSSIPREEPTTFPVNGVIEGWQQSIPLMPQGSKWRIYIPSELGYGEQGAGAESKIGPNAVLIFDVELLKINDK